MPGQVPWHCLLKLWARLLWQGSYQSHFTGGEIEAPSPREVSSKFAKLINGMALSETQACMPAASSLHAAAPLLVPVV